MRIKFLNRNTNRAISSAMHGFKASKRQRFIVSVAILSFGLFVSEYFLGRSGIFMVFALSGLASFLLYFSLYNDLEDNFYWQIFILPFFYSLAFGLFYLLVPARFLTRVVMTSLYAVGLYSLFLSINIFTVSSIRTIALLTSARTVSFAIMLLSYFFLSNVVFSLHVNLLFTLILTLAYILPMVVVSVWFYTLEKSIRSNFIWTGSITLLLMEITLILWFWSSTPTLIALFMTGIFYTLVGLSQAWFEKRLFRGVILEYFWVCVVSFLIFIIFSS